MSSQKSITFGLIGCLLTVAMLAGILFLPLLHVDNFHIYTGHGYMNEIDIFLLRLLCGTPPTEIYLGAIISILSCIVAAVMLCCKSPKAYIAQSISVLGIIIIEMSLLAIPSSELPSGAHMSISVGFWILLAVSIAWTICLYCKRLPQQNLNRLPQQNLNNNMSNLIIALRKWSLRWVIIAVLAVSILTISLLGATSGNALSAISTLVYVGLITTLMFTVAWCAQAITDIKKASIVIGVISAATALNFICQMIGFNNLAGGNTGSSMGIQVFANSYQTSMLLYIVSAAAFIYAFKSVYSKYRVCWIMMIIAYILNAIGLGMVVSSDLGDLVSNTSLQGVSTLLGLIVYIVLLCVGNNKDFRIANTMNDISNSSDSK